MTIAFDYAIRLADLASNLDNDIELFTEEQRKSVYITMLAMENLALTLHPTIFDDPAEPVEPEDVFSPHTVIIE